MKTKHAFACGIPRHRPLKVVVIGSGGTGSAILFGLPYLHQAMQAWGFRWGLEVTVIDGDTVSDTNCVRQPFGMADVGLNKATVLVGRVNLFHGLAWTAVPHFFAPQKNPPNLTPSYDSRIGFVISCVDTRAARQVLDQALTGETRPWNTVHYWLDLGNDAGSGQYVLGQPLNRVNKRSPERLRTAAELFPSIVETSRGEDELPSCSAAEALDRQEPFINSVLAASALAMLTRLIRHGELDYHGSFYNAASGRSSPLAIDPRQWELERRRAAKRRAA